ncbi:MAG: 16S rRNA (uracil(1498)-N(3))-methyltransferase [Prevotellaceae bacterium]|jgi:16S rRNA (uracil1498-N3)-methyltransferase|nr:16S rRNA (uracil(1498)-N(3))-methyltransferase [Prevotellaceae bacterium]
MNLFYTPDIAGEAYTLSEEESKHCVRVLRLAAGDTIYLIDGHGGLYTAAITAAHDKRCEVRVTQVQREYGKRNYHLHIAIAPTKNVERYEWFLEKITEIGVDEITPLLCEHSERKVVKDERSEKVVTSAVKQSLKAYHPRLNAMTDFRQLVTQPFDGVKCIAHCADAPKILLKNAVKAGENVLVLIGPEGDFSPKEVALAKQHGFIEVSLGSSRLRTETAGVTACVVVAVMNDKEIKG